MLHCQCSVFHLICLIVTILIDIWLIKFLIVQQSSESKYLMLTIRLIPMIIFVNHLFLIPRIESIFDKTKPTDPIYFSLIMQFMQLTHWNSIVILIRYQFNSILQFICSYLQLQYLVELFHWIISKFLIINHGIFWDLLIA